MASAAAAPACATESGISFGPWQQPARKMPSVKVLTGASLGCRSRKKPSVPQLMLNMRRTLWASAWGSSPIESTTMSTGMLADIRPHQGVFDPDDQLAFLLLGKAQSVDIGHRPRMTCTPSSASWL